MTHMLVIYSRKHVYYLHRVPSPHPVHNVTTMFVLLRRSMAAYLVSTYGNEPRDSGNINQSVQCVLNRSPKPPSSPRSFMSPARWELCGLAVFAPAINSDRAPLASNDQWSRPVESQASSFWPVEFLFYWSGRSTATQSISLCRLLRLHCIRCCNFLGRSRARCVP
jgi:hypothetical protein